MSAHQPKRRPAPFFDRPLIDAGEDETLRAAEHELGAVRRSEQARLLCAAAALCGARMQPADLLFQPVLLPSSTGDWRRRTARVLELMRGEQQVDAAEERARALLEGMVDAPVRAWPDAVALARAALALRGDEATRLALGQAELSVGALPAALEVFLELLRDEVRPRWRTATLEGLAAAQARLGRPLLALGAFDQAADDPRSSPLALVGALAFALWLGDAGRGLRAAARLDLLVDPTRPSFLAALARLRGFAASPPGGLAASPQRGLAANPQRGLAANPQRGLAANPQRGLAANPTEGAPLRSGARFALAGGGGAGAGADASRALLELLSQAPASPAGRVLAALS